MFNKRFQFFIGKCRKIKKKYPKSGAMENRLRIHLAKCIDNNGGRKVAEFFSAEVFASEDKGCRDAIEQLEKAHILRNVETSGTRGAVDQKFYELAHDIWVKIIQEWNARLEGWDPYYFLDTSRLDNSELQALYSSLVDENSIYEPFNDEDLSKRTNTIAR